MNLHLLSLKHLCWSLVVMIFMICIVLFSVLAHVYRRSMFFLMHQGLTKLCCLRSWVLLDVKLTSVPHQLGEGLCIKSGYSPMCQLTFNKMGQCLIFCESSSSCSVMISLGEDVKSRGSNVGGPWALLSICVRIKGAPGWMYVQLYADIVCLCVFF